MSKRDAESRKALFDRMEGRGDVLSIPVEKGAELAALPKDMFAEITYPLFQWWIYGTDTEPSDPRDKMVFVGLKTHQIENSVKRGMNLKNWLDNANKGGRPPSEKKPKVNHARTKRKPSAHSNVDRVLDEEQDKSSSSVCTLSTGEDSPQGVQSPAALPPSIEEARRWLEIHAPECASNGKLYADDEYRTPKGCWPHQYLCVNALDAAKMLAETKLPLVPAMFLEKLQKAITTSDDNAIIGTLTVLHDDVFKRVMLHAYCEDVPNEDDKQKQLEASHRIYKAVNNCATMLDIIHSTDSDPSGE